jgi:hypothetical protein
MKSKAIIIECTTEKVKLMSLQLTLITLQKNYLANFFIAAFYQLK